MVGQHHNNYHCEQQTSIYRVTEIEHMILLLLLLLLMMMMMMMQMKETLSVLNYDVILISILPVLFL